MTINVYESLFILDANRYARDAAGVSGQIPELIEKNGGKMLASRLWEERRLAYPINGQRKGTYWLTYFKLDAASLVYTNAPQIIRAFDEGAVIRSKRGRFLAIPTENAPRKGTDGKRISPSTFPAHRFGPHDVCWFLDSGESDCL